MSNPQNVSSPPKARQLVAPSKEHIEWLNAELGVIIHLDVQVFESTYNFRDQWGYTPDPKVFNPSSLDTDQWLSTAAKAGAKYAILVAKHCSGFSLWPTKAHDYNVANSPWKNGKGDLVKDFVESCKKYTIKPGIYCTATANAYFRVDNPGRVVGGTEEDNQNYNQMLLLQLRELWSNYGPLFELWFDGGILTVEEGGPDVSALQNELQPDAVILDAPLGYEKRTRNSGAEDGAAVLPALSTTDAENPTRGGSFDGNEFIPIECDLPNRNAGVAFQGGWFWREGEDETVYSVSDLVDRYYKSVGQNSNLLLGMVIDNRGLVPDVDRKTFETFGEVIHRIKELPRDRSFGKEHIIEVDITQGDFVSEALIREDFSQGENIRKYQLEAFVDDTWQLVFEGEGIGHKRILPFPKVRTKKMRLTILDCVQTPNILEFSVYLRIPLLQAPSLSRDDEGYITINMPIDSKVVYTLDGSMPTFQSPVYKDVFLHEAAGHLRAMTLPDAGVDPLFPELKTQPIEELFFGKTNLDWQVISADSEYDEQNKKENLLTNNGFPWISGKEAHFPHEISVDMQTEIRIQGFVYTPPFSWRPGLILSYAFYVGDTPENITTFVQKGSFPDIANMPSQQRVLFKEPIRSRYFKFVPTASATGTRYASVGLFEIIAD